VLDICLNPQKDVLETDEAGMTAKLEDIMKRCKHNNYTVRADVFMPHGELDFELAQIKKWAVIAEKYLGKK